VEIVTKTRTEHMSEEDKQQAKVRFLQGFFSIIIRMKIIEKVRLKGQSSEIFIPFFNIYG
jgi:hypothetical protein